MSPPLPQLHHLPQDRGDEEHAEPRLAGLRHPGARPLQRRLRPVSAAVLQAAPLCALFPSSLWYPPAPGSPSAPWFPPDARPFEPPVPLGGSASRCLLSPVSDVAVATVDKNIPPKPAEKEEEEEGEKPPWRDRHQVDVCRAVLWGAGCDTAPFLAGPSRWRCMTGIGMAGEPGGSGGLLASPCPRWR